MKTVGIIGGAGFIGSYVTQKFLNEGYAVRVSASDPGNADKYAHLQALDYAEDLTLVPCDVRDLTALEAFMQGCDLLIHGGTPFNLAVNDPQTELFEPTVTGTENFLNRLNQSKTIRNVVMVASVAGWNTSFPLPPATVAKGHVFSEADMPYFSAEDHPYAQAKFRADQAVRTFTAEHPDLPVQITTVSPVMVIGNALSARPDSTSLGVQFLIKNKLAPNPFLERLFALDAAFAMVDVRDVAGAIFRAATRPGLHGKNYLLASQSYPISDISRMLNGEAPAAAGAIVYDSSLAQRDLGVVFRPVQQTLNECV